MHMKSLPGQLMFLCILLAAASNAQPSIGGLVLNNATLTPVAYADVVISGTQQGVACDSSGAFQLCLPPGEYQLEISALGYQTVRHRLTVRQGENAPLRILLAPAVIALSDAVLVYSEESPHHIDQWLNATDDVLQKAEGVAMIRRANFALEPTLRGLNSGQIGLVIDGMKIFSACVDRMDPVTAYVEVENLEKLEVSRGAFDLTKSASVGGTINLVTRKPDFQRPFSLQAESGYETVSRLRRLRSEVNYASANLALRGTFSIKSAGNYYAGNRILVTNSGFEKNNYKLDAVRKFAGNHIVEFSFIGDNARDIGYPVLLMDATRTKSQIYRLTHRWDSPGAGIQSLNSTVYYNRIDHWMDDYQRDVTGREVMPDMYMPMFGYTRTLGAIGEITVARGQHLLSAVLDGYRLSAFADMKMESIFPDVSDAYLLNIGDAQVYNLAFILDHQWMPSARLRVRSNLRIDHSSRDLRNEFGRRQLQGFWDNISVRQSTRIFSAGSFLEYRLGRHHILQGGLAQSRRLPTHIESYGFFLYNVTDGYFYTGNPGLAPERSRQIEIGFEQIDAPLRWRVNAYYNHIDNYISGVLQSDEFKTFANIRSAVIAGGELSATFAPGGPLRLSTSLAYTYGHNREMDEPLPLIPPLEGGIGLQYRAGGFWLGLDSRFGSRQERIASRTTREDETAGFFIVNFRARLPLAKHFESQLGVENFLDQQYHEHLSINNLPGRGRNFYFGLSAHLPD